MPAPGSPRIWVSRAIFANVHLLRIGDFFPELLNRRLNEALICNEKQERFQSQKPLTAPISQRPRMKALSGIHSVREGGIKRGPVTSYFYMMTGFFIYLLAIQGNILPFLDPSSILVMALSFCIPVRSPRQDLLPACSEIGLSVNTVVAGYFGLVH